MNTPTPKQKNKWGLADKHGDFPYLCTVQWKKDHLNEILMERLPESYDMQLVDPVEIRVLAAVVNMGIDSHLEAATLTVGPHAVPLMVGDTCISNKYGIGFDKLGMICLVRRLMEFEVSDHQDLLQGLLDGEAHSSDAWEAASGLVSSILETLQIEYSG